MRRSLVDSSLRYLELQPGPGVPSPWLAAISWTAVVGATVFYASPIPMLAALAPGVGAASFLISRYRTRRRWGGIIPVPSPLTITPWGFVVERPFSWPEVARIEHEKVVVHEGEEGGPRWADQRELSVLYVDVGGRRIAASRDFELILDSLADLVGRYAAEVGLPIALRLPGAPVNAAPLPAGRADSMPWSAPRAFPTLLAAARALLASDAGRELLTVRGERYRDGTWEVSPEARALLSQALTSAPAAIDLAPLAAVLAAELGLVELVPALCALVMAPNALVAGVAKAAALRLGAPIVRPGSIEETRPFLAEAEIAALQTWAAEHPGSATPPSAGG